MADRQPTGGLWLAQLEVKDAWMWKKICLIQVCVDASETCCFKGVVLDQMDAKLCV